MTPQQIAEQLGIKFEKQSVTYLNLCVKSGNQLMTSGHVSTLKGKLGAGLTTEEGYAAARDCVAKILNSVWNVHGTLDGLRVLKLFGCVNSAPVSRSASQIARPRISSSSWWPRMRRPSPWSWATPGSWPPSTPRNRRASSS